MKSSPLPSSCPPVRPNGCSKGHQSKAKLLLTTAWLILAGASHAAPLFTEGFNSGFSSPYAANPETFGPVFGVSAPGIVADGNNGTAATEGDSFAGMNTNRPIDGTPNIFTRMGIALGTVTAAGTTYTFTGDFGWRFGTVASASELNIHNGGTGFVVGGGGLPTALKDPNSGDADAGGNITINFGTDFVAGTLNPVSFSYTTVAADIGAPLFLRISFADQDAVEGLTQLLTDNWVVTAVGQQAPPAITSISVSGNTATLTMTGDDAVPYYCASSVDLAGFTTEETALVTGTATPLSSPFNTSSGTLTFDIDITGRTDRLFFRIQDSDPNP